MALVAELEKVRQEMAENDARATALCAGLSEEQLARRPAPKAWSIAENLTHLHVTTKTLLPSLDQAIERARERNLRGEGPFRLGRMDRLFVWYVEPPPVIRLPAPKILRPVLSGPAIEALPGFLESQEWVLKRLEAANGLDLIRARYISPLARYIRMSLLGVFCVFTGHERRHLWQAANVRQHLGLSRASP